MADGNSGLRIVDVSLPTNPFENSYYNTQGYTYGVYVKGSYAYVADGHYYGLRIIDISTWNPYEIGYCNTPGPAYDVYVLNSYAYVVDSFGLRVIDISNPTSPHQVGSYITQGIAYDVYVSDFYAYVADGNDGLRIIDVSDPVNPYEVGYYDTPGQALGVFVDNFYAYVADGDSGLRVIDVSNPANPREVGYYDTPWYAQGIYVKGSYVYLASPDFGLEIYENLLADVQENNNRRVDYSGLSVIMKKNGVLFSTNANTTNPIEISIYDACGRLVKEAKVKRKYYFKPEKSGVYFYLAESNRVKRHGKFLVMW